MDEPSMNHSQSASWPSREFRAMGCTMAVWLDTEDPAIAETAFDQVEELFEVNEQALSRFRSDSELCQLNVRSGRWVTVSELLWDVLTLAFEMAAATNGRFDPTTLNALEHYGYTVTFERLGDIDQDYLPPRLAPSAADWMAVRLDENRRAILLPKGLKVDLGGIAKGYTAQQAADMLRSFGPCLVDAGGDLVAGAAPRGLPGWPVAISAPWADDGEDRVDLCKLWLADQALATSGIDYRTWQRNGRLVHHLIDPATGAPALTDGLTVSILANDGALAEAWATATLVAGSELGLNCLLEAGLAGLMVTQTGGILVTPLMHQALQLAPLEAS